MNPLVAELADKALPIEWLWFNCVAGALALFVLQINRKWGIRIAMVATVCWANTCFFAFDSCCDPALRADITGELGTGYLAQIAFSLIIPPSIGLAALLRTTRNARVPAAHKP